MTGSRPLVLLLVGAALVRVFGLSGPGHEGDVNAFVQWAEGVARSGIAGYYESGGTANYPPMLYLLWPLGVALDGADLEFAIRSLSIPFDLALGVLLCHAARAESGEDGDGLLAAGFYLYNPAVVLTGPMWGQVEGMGALPMVGAVVAAARGRFALAGVLAVLAGLMKPQFGIAALVLAGLGVTWLRSWAGLRRALTVAVAALVTLLVVLVPLGLPHYVSVMNATFTQYPYVSAFGFNPWAIAFGFGDGDGPWFQVGTLLAATGVVASLWLLRSRRDLVGMLGVSVLIGLAIYYLPTRVHERYLFGAIAFLALLAAIHRPLRWPFVALSLAFFGTLVYVLATSPYRILPGPQLPPLLDWAISAASAVVTLIGAWTAWRVVALFGGEQRSVDGFGVGWPAHDDELAEAPR